MLSVIWTPQFSELNVCLSHGWNNPSFTVQLRFTCCDVYRSASQTAAQGTSNAAETTTEAARKETVSEKTDEKVHVITQSTPTTDRFRGGWTAWQLPLSVYPGKATTLSIQVKLPLSVYPGTATTLSIQVKLLLSVYPKYSDYSVYPDSTANTLCQSK